MPDLLVRNVDENTKRNLAIQAAQNGRSVQAEAKAILEAATASQTDTWVEFLMKHTVNVGELKLDIPRRSLPREFSFDEELTCL